METYNPLSDLHPAHLDSVQAPCAYCGGEWEDGPLFPTLAHGEDCSYANVMRDEFVLHGGTADLSEATDWLVGMGYESGAALLEASRVLNRQSVWADWCREDREVVRYARDDYSNEWRRTLRCGHAADATLSTEEYYRDHDLFLA